MQRHKFMKMLTGAAVSLIAERAPQAAMPSEVGG